jgi:TPR repeat protein
MARATSRAATAMLRAAESGDCQSQVNLAVIHDNRRSAGALEGLSPQGLSPAVAAAAEHDAQSLRWWLRAASQGSAKAQAALALRYENGDGVVQDLVGALAWYLLAAPRLRGDEGERVEQARLRLSRRMEPADVARAARRAAQWRPQTEAVAASA